MHISCIYVHTRQFSIFMTMHHTCIGKHTSCSLACFIPCIINGFEQKLVCSDSNLMSVVNYVVLIREEHCSYFEFFHVAH